MKTNFLLIVLLSLAFNFVFSQVLRPDQEEEIKKIIFDDLIHLNDVLDKCLIQPS